MKIKFPSALGGSHHAVLTLSIRNSRTYLADKQEASEGGIGRKCHASSVQALEGFHRLCTLSSGSSFPQRDSYSWLLRALITVSESRGQRAEAERFLPAHSPGTSAFISSNGPAGTSGSNIFFITCNDFPPVFTLHKCWVTRDGEAALPLEPPRCLTCPTHLGDWTPVCLGAHKASVYEAALSPRPCSLSPYFKSKNDVFKE